MNEKVSISLADCRPLDDHVLLLRLPPLGDGSLIAIPDAYKEASKRGKVLRTGPGRKMDGWIRPMDVHLDDVVHYQSCDVDDGTYVLIAEGDILGVETNA